ncbi:MAG: hypothetical protein HQL15_08755 [Candidatus Omnitrophica bacterium]|nr:hypothetical protein [Candidatus Omnitrophota bacterium]
MRRLSQNKGYALAFSLIFLFLIVSFVAAYILASAHGLSTANRGADSSRAYYIADAGITDAFIQLRGYSSPASSFTVSNASFDPGSGKMGSYSVTAASNGASWPIYTLTSVGTYNGVTKTLVLKAQQTSISSYAYLSNTEIHPTYGALWWITGMTTVGPVRTNGTLNISGSPIFDGTTTQSGSAINYYNGVTSNPNFVNGLTLSAPTVTFPTTALLNNISSSASSGGLVLTGNSTVVFNANGTINVTNSARGWNNTNMAKPTNGMIYVQNTNSSTTDGNVTVQGTVKGQVTVASANQMYISGNLVYNTDPRTNPASTDMLGLVSKNDITVLANSAPANLELDAVIVALNGSFQVDQWWLTGKGNMIQYGSLVNNYCGPTGVFDPSTGNLTGGYNQLQYYDTRLQTMIPPGFMAAVDSTGRTVYVKLSYREL